MKKTRSKTGDKQVQQAQETPGNLPAQDCCVQILGSDPTLFCVTHGKPYASQHMCSQHQNQRCTEKWHSQRTHAHLDLGLSRTKAAQKPTDFHDFHNLNETKQSENAAYFQETKDAHGPIA